MPAGGGGVRLDLSRRGHGQPDRRLFADGGRLSLAGARHRRSVQRLRDSDGEPELRPGHGRRLHRPARRRVRCGHGLSRRVAPEPAQLPCAHLGQHVGDRRRRLSLSAPDRPGDAADRRGRHLAGLHGGDDHELSGESLPVRAQARPLRLLRRALPGGGTLRVGLTGPPKLLGNLQWPSRARLGGFQQSSL